VVVAAILFVNKMCPWVCHISKLEQRLSISYCDLALVRGRFWLLVCKTSGIGQPDFLIHCY